MFWEENPQFYFIWAKSEISVNDKSKIKIAKLEVKKPFTLWLRKLTKLPTK